MLYYREYNFPLAGCIAVVAIATGVAGLYTRAWIMHVKPIEVINKLAKIGYRVVTMSSHCVPSGLMGPASYMYVIPERAK